MNARQLRRAQERKERKLARKAEPQLAALNPLNPEDEPAPLSEAKTQDDARLAANRANAQLSSGPKTAEGKAVSSMNALKSGLTGRTVLLPSEDASEYQAHCARLRNKWKPEGDDECSLIQSIADTEWRLRRIPMLEFAIYAKGRTEFYAQPETADTTAPDPALVDLETYLRYEKQLRNLSVQEGRLNRQRDKHIAELRQLQSERHARHAEQSESAAAASGTTEPVHAGNHGFVFSTASIEPSAASLAPAPRMSEPSFMEAQAA